ncbi:hypothetical protein ULMS_20820 [Patiriisocius marinistellae]|uniref:Phospholipase/carboxylesterase/thioesterase domain-containing protein n=1 Tax=Patiriisocius marinistellae TaxID=2494560 RepID=A0A5J4FZF7_9FLAO|nr:esterase [Patiriisocius marinistellae]GEQ86574.1 hypothetical protein ULMS_20820 [Patiriisocius marinistellae]
MAIEKSVNYTSKNTFETLNKLTPKTKNVWFVFHGLGYLSRYFLKSFETLNNEENYIIAPQAPSKFYLGSKFKHVGACWLTKENTAVEKENVLRYIDAVYEAEISETPINFIVLGYSQGVSIATRWLASRKIQCKQLILHSGAIPVELTPDDFEFLSPTTMVTYLYGDADEYITEAKKTEENLKGDKLFGNRLETQVFKGIHEVHVASLEKFAKKK